MSEKPIRRMRRYVWSRRKWSLRLIFWGGAITIGALSVLFILATFASDDLFRHFYQQYPFLALLVPPFGLAGIAYLTRTLFKGTEGSGIPQTIAGLQMERSQARSSIFSLKVAFGKAVLTCGGLLSGASIGPQGPTVQIGAAIMYSLRRIAPFRGRGISKALIMGGGAAGISAAFNAPLAGIMFAIEEMGRSFEDRTNSIVLIAVILAGITALAILGNHTYFGSSAAHTKLKEVWPAIIICGVLGGLFGGAFSSAVIFLGRRIATYAKQHPVLLAAICGVIVSLLGLISDGDTFGTGYVHAKTLIAGEQPTDFMFPVYKLIATITSSLSGIPGGIFAPSLSVGAGIGANVAQYLPDIPLSVIVVLGMVGYFTGVVQTPLTALIIVMELTDNSSMILPLMATALIAKGVSRWICPQPLYQVIAETYIRTMLNQTRKDSDKREPKSDTP